MSDPATTVTPPAASGGLTADQVKSLVSEMLKVSLGEALKPITDSIGQLKASQTAAAPAAGAKPAEAASTLTAEQVSKIVAEQIAAASSAQATAQTNARAKADFVSQNLKGVPAVYAEKLGGDPAKWADEAKALRKNFQDDLAANGIKAPPVSSDAGAGGTVKPGGQIDTSKLSGFELIKLGVTQTPAAQALQGAAANAPGAAAGAQGAAAATA
ncbi:MAG TPA: hypothetical protein VHQ47_17700 [Phycisphaerae bacterium]|nr:hypothetical protein [Phycisphaerae bacterium]